MKKEKNPVSAEYREKRDEVKDYLKSITQIKEISQMENQKIFSSLVGVMADIGAIGKDKKNQQQGFMYRGIDDVMNALQPALVKNKVVIIPEVLEESREERVTAKGGTMFSVRLRMKFTFAAEDSSTISTVVIGEAMDSGDKATNKAMSIAYKYACFQTFCIPTEEMKNADPDGYIPEPSKKKTPIKKIEPLEETTEEEDPIIDATKIKVLKEMLVKKGISEDAVTGRYKVKSIKNLTVTQFAGAMRSLEKTPDKKPVDLGF